MTTPAVVFVNGLIDAFSREHARKIIVAPLTTNAGWSRMFTGYSPDAKIAAALYDQLFKITGKGVLDVEMDDEDGQLEITAKVKKGLESLTQEIVEAFLTLDRSDLKPEVKAAIGDQYDEIKAVLGENQIIMDLVTAGIAVYAEVLTYEFYLRNGIKSAAGSYAGEKLTEKQNRHIQGFNFNISNKINEYLRNLTIDDLRKPAVRGEKNPVSLSIVAIATQSMAWFANNFSFIFVLFNQVSHDQKQVERTRTYEPLPQIDPDLSSHAQKTDRCEHTSSSLESSLSKIDVAISDAIDGLMVYKDMLSQSGSTDAIHALDQVQASIHHLQEEQIVLRTMVLNISNQSLTETIDQSEKMLTNIKMALSTITQPTDAPPRSVFNLSYLMDCVREFIAGVPTRNVMNFLENDKNKIIKSMDKMKAELGKIRPADEPEVHHHLDLEE